METKVISINGVDYAPVGREAKRLNNMEYKIVRTYSAGVFAGYIESRNGREVVIRNARRLWKWSGAASLSQLAVDGTNDPKNCKFPVPVDRIEVLEAIEIINVTETAKESIEGITIWEM